MVNLSATSLCSTNFEPGNNSWDTFFYQGTTSVPKVALYNITADPTEHEDLSEKLPDMVKALQERVQYYMKGAVPPLNKTPDPKAFLKAKLEGVWTPWQD